MGRSGSDRGMSDLTVDIIGAGDVRRVELSLEMAGSIERVWMHLTNLTSLGQWWPDWIPGGHLEARLGGRIRLGDGGWIDGHFKEWSPPHCFSFSWHDHLDAQALPDWFEAHTQSLLSVELVAVGPQRTRIWLTQYMPAGHAPGGAAGWHYFAGLRLPELVSTNSVSVQADPHVQLLEHYQQVATATLDPQPLFGRIWGAADPQAVCRVELNVQISAEVEAVWQAITDPAAKAV